jgi:hypothetical protein
MLTILISYHCLQCLSRLEYLHGRTREQYVSRRIERLLECWNLCPDEDKEQLMKRLLSRLRTRWGGPCNRISQLDQYYARLSEGTGNDFFQ